MKQGRIHGYQNACGWAGAIFEVTRASARISEAKDRKKEAKYDGQTDGWTDKAGCRVA